MSFLTTVCDYFLIFAIQQLFLFLHLFDYVITIFHNIPPADQVCINLYFSLLSAWLSKCLEDAYHCCQNMPAALIWFHTPEHVRKKKKKISICFTSQTSSRVQIDDTMVFFLYKYELSHLDNYYLHAPSSCSQRHTFQNPHPSKCQHLAESKLPEQLVIVFVLLLFLCYIIGRCDFKQSKPLSVSVKFKSLLSSFVELVWVRYSLM